MPASHSSFALLPSSFLARSFQPLEPQLPQLPPISTFAPFNDNRCQSRIKDRMLTSCRGLKTSHQNREMATNPGKIMVIDTETTGLPPKACPTFTRSWAGCRMLEIAWHVYHPDGTLDHEQSYLVKPTFKKEVPWGALRVHGINRAKAMAEGHPIDMVLDALASALNGVTRLVGHNIHFDFRVIHAEICRHKHEHLMDHWPSLPMSCTMRESVKVTGKKRWQKLTDLYHHFFGENPSGVLHRAMADVAACARIYFHMNRTEVLNPSAATAPATKGRRKTVTKVIAKVTKVTTKRTRKVKQECKQEPPQTAAPEGADKAAMDKLLSFLEGTTSASAETLTVILGALAKAAKAKVADRAYLRLRISWLTQDANSLRNKMCFLLTSNIAGVRNSSGDLLFTLCDQNAQSLVEFAGYENAAGWLAENGLLG